MSHGEELVQFLSSAKQRYETLSEVAKRHSTDTAELLTKLNEVLNAVFPNRLAIPLGFAEYMEALKIKADGAKTVASLDGQIDWDYAMRLVSGELREDPLPDGIREGTLQARVYMGIAAGSTTLAALKQQLSLSERQLFDSLYLLKKKGVVEKSIKDEYAIRRQSPPTSSSPINGPNALLPSCLKEGTVLAKIWTAIAGGKTAVEKLRKDFGKSLSYNLVVLQKKGVVERTGRGIYKIKQDGPTQPDAVTGRKVQVRSTLLTYLQANALEKEIPYRDIIREMERLGLNKNSVYAELGLSKRKGVITGTSGMARYTGKKDANAPLPAAPSYVSGTGMERTQAANLPPGGAALLAEIPDIASYYGVLPDLDRELSEFETAAERLPREQLSRAYMLVLGMLGEREAVTAAHADALQPLYKAFRESDAQQLISHLESKGQLSPEEMVRYVGEFIARQKSPVPPITPVIEKTSGRPLPEKTLDAYSGLSGNMRDAVTKLKSVIAISGGNGQRIERLALGYLPEKPETTTSFQQTAVAAIANAFKRVVNDSVDPKDLLAYLEEKERRPENILQYVNDFFDRENTMPAYWRGVIANHGSIGQSLVLYLHCLTSQPPFEQKVRRYLGDNASDPSRVYHIQQIGKFIQRAERDLGTVPHEVYVCLGSVLDSGNAYLPSIIRLIGDKSKLSTADRVEMLKEIQGKSDRSVVKTVNQYSARA